VKIRGSRIKNLTKHLKRVPPGAEYRIVLRIAPDERQRLLSRTGFASTAEVGATILPKSIGPVTRFNAFGKRVPLKNLPKQPRYIRTIEWTWEQWDGRYGTKTMSEERDVFQDCYQVEIVPPPSIEVCIVERNGEWFIVSPRLKSDNRSATGDVHVVNLFLELYGICEIVRDDLGSFDPPTVRYVNWRLLPQGRHPWSKVAEHLESILLTKDPRIRVVISNRHETINSYSPDEIYVGEGGFQRYVAYVFVSRGLVVLECTELDNAIYVFGLEWAEFSKLSKAEILASEIHLERIVHSDGWRSRLNRLMRSR